jgi:hypothetical protein
MKSTTTNPHRHGKETAKALRKELKGYPVSVRSGKWRTADWVEVGVLEDISDEDYNEIQRIAGAHRDMVYQRYYDTGTSVCVTPKYVPGGK